MEEIATEAIKHCGDHCKLTETMDNILSQVSKTNTFLTGDFENQGFRTEMLNKFHEQNIKIDELDKRLIVIESIKNKVSNSVYDIIFKITSALFMGYLFIKK